MSDAKMFSALFYLLVFASSVVCFYLEELSLRKNGCRPLAACLFAAGVLIPSLIAGLRGDNVGRDVLTYVVPNMDDAVVCSSMEEVCEAVEGAWEWAYVGLLYGLSRFFTDAGPLLFSFQLLTVGPIALAAFLMRRQLNPALAMAVYFFCYYNWSFNMMRQFVAVAFVLLGLVLFIRREGRFGGGGLWLGCLAFACLFHKSGVLGVVEVFGLYWICRRYPGFFNWKFWLSLLIALLALFRFLNPILEAASALNSNLRTYADVFVYGTADKDWFADPFGAFTLMRWVLDLCLVALPLCLWRFRGADIESGQLEFGTFSKMCIIGWLVFMLILFGLKTGYGVRLTIYWDAFILLLLPMALRAVRNKGLASIGVCGFLLLYWFIRSIRLDDDIVVVYSLRI